MEPPTLPCSVLLIRGVRAQGWSRAAPHSPPRPPHLQPGRLGLQRGVVLLQEGALLLQRQDLAAEGHALGLQVLQLVPEQLLLGLQSRVLGGSTRPSDTPCKRCLSCKEPSEVGAVGASRGEPVLSWKKHT